MVRWRRTSDRSGDDADDALAARACHDGEAFALLYARYFNSVYRYCYRRLSNPEAAADATSLVFTKALVALPTHRGVSFRSWLFSIAHNVIADSFRSGLPFQPLEDAGDLVDTAPTPEEIALEREEHRLLQTLLAQLPVDQRRVIELRLAGLTGVEIAGVIGRSHAAVKMLQARAIARLRELRQTIVDTDHGRHSDG